MMLPTVKEVSIITMEQRQEVLKYLLFLKTYFHKNKKFEARIKVEKVLYQFLVMKRRIVDIKTAVSNKNREENYLNFSLNLSNNMQQLEILSLGNNGMTKTINFDIEHRKSSFKNSTFYPIFCSHFS